MKKAPAAPLDGESLKLEDVRCALCGKEVSFTRAASGAPCLVELSLRPTSFGRYRPREETLEEIDGEDFAFRATQGDKRLPLEATVSREWLRVVRELEQKAQEALGQQRLQEVSWVASTRRDACFFQVQLTPLFRHSATAFRVTHEDGSCEEGAGPAFVRGLAVRYGNDLEGAAGRALAAVGGYCMAPLRPSTALVPAGIRLKPTSAGLRLVLVQLDLDFSRRR
jgi:hypothetical protein